MTYGLGPYGGSGTLPPALSTGTAKRTPLRLRAGAEPGDGAGDPGVTDGAAPAAAVAGHAAAEASAVVVAEVVVEGGKPVTAAGASVGPPP